MRLIDADALKKEFPKDTDWEYPTNTNEYVCEKIDAQPTVQPEINCSEIPNNSDTISRQQAIDALDKRFDKIPMGQTTEILMLRKDLRELPSVQPERKDAVEKAVAVEAVCDELMSRFDVSATYAYEIAEKAMNRIEEMAKEMGKGEQDG